MVSKSIDSRVSPFKSIAPKAIAATETGTAVDLQNYESAEIVVEAGVITDGTHVISLTECDTSGGSYTAVAAGDLIGTPPTLTSAAGGSTAHKFAYKGSKRYLKVVSTVSGATTGGVYGACVVRGDPRHVS
jgi:hypothetical protein